MDAIPTPAAFRRGCEEFRLREPRDSMYRVATFLVEHWWGRPAEMADGLGVLLLTWNQAFYRYGAPDFDRLELCIGETLPRVERFRRRHILSLRPGDVPEIVALFEAYLAALAIGEGTAAGRRSPVSAAKALHLLAPEFLPLWDRAIAKSYGCRYDIESAASYVRFCRIMREAAEAFVAAGEPEASLLKRIDEYNYATITKAWA